MSFTAAFNDRLFQKYGVTVKDKIELTFSLLISTFKDLKDAEFKGKITKRDSEDAAVVLDKLWNNLLKVQAYYDPVVENYSVLANEFSIAVMELRKEVMKLRAKLQLDDPSAMAVVMAYE